MGRCIRWLTKEHDMIAAEVAAEFEAFIKRLPSEHNPDGRPGAALSNL